MRERREEGGGWLVSPSAVSLHPKAPITRLQAGRGKRGIVK